MKYPTNLTHTSSTKLRFYITCMTTWIKLNQKLDEVPDKFNRRLQQLRRGGKAQKEVATMVLGWDRRPSALGDGGWATEPAMASRKYKWGREKRERFHPGVRLLLGNQTDALREKPWRRRERVDAIRGGELASKFVKLVGWLAWLACSSSCDDNRLRCQAKLWRLSLVAFSLFIWEYITEFKYLFSRFGHSDAMNEFIIRCHIIETIETY